MVIFNRVELKRLCMVIFNGLAKNNENSDESSEKTNFKKPKINKLLILIVLSVTCFFIALFLFVEPNNKEEKKDTISDTVYKLLLDTHSLAIKDPNREFTIADSNPIYLSLTINKHSEESILLSLSMKMPLAEICQNLDGLEKKEFILSVNVDGIDMLSTDDYLQNCSKYSRVKVVFLK